MKTPVSSLCVGMYNGKGVIPEVNFNKHMLAEMNNAHFFLA